MTVTLFRSATATTAAIVLTVGVAAGAMSGCASEEEKQQEAAAHELVAAYAGDWTVPASCFGTETDVTIHLGPADNKDLDKALDSAVENRAPEGSYLDQVTPIAITAEGSPVSFATTGNLVKAAGEIPVEEENTTYEGLAVMGIKPADPTDPDNTQVVQIPFIATNTTTGESGFTNFLGYRTAGNLVASCQLRPTCDAEVMSKLYVTLLGAKTRGDIERLTEKAGHLPDLIRCGTEQPTELVRQGG